MVHQLEVERGYHIFPIVVVGRHENDTLPLLVVSVYQLSVDKMIASHDRLWMGIKVIYALNQQVADMVIVRPFYLFAFLCRTVRV